jgi:hypothetical protein
MYLYMYTYTYIYIYIFAWRRSLAGGRGGDTVARALRLGLDLLLGSLSDCCLVLFLCNSRNRILLGMSCVLCTQKALGRPVGPMITSTVSLVPTLSIV